MLSVSKCLKNWDVDGEIISVVRLANGTEFVK
jgi:hypothetical protein